MTDSKLRRALAARRADIERIDYQLIGDTLGVAQALAELRAALDQIDSCLNHRDFERASAIGYGAVADNFIFLQRCLGGLQGDCCAKAEIIQDIALATGRGDYMEVLPHVDALMTSSKPLPRARSRKSREQDSGDRRRSSRKSAHPTKPRAR